MEGSTIAKAVVVLKYHSGSCATAIAAVASVSETADAAVALPPRRLPAAAIENDDDDDDDDDEELRRRSSR